MNATKRLFVALSLSLLGSGPAMAFGPLGPGGPSATEKMTVVDSQTQNAVNTTSYFVLPVIGSIIQQSLQGHGKPGWLTGSLDPNHRGMAAGDDGLSLQTWVEGDGGHSHNSLSVGGYDLNNYGTQAGIQAQLTPTFLLGVSVSWQGSNGSLNGGFTSRNQTYGVTPYLGWQFSEHWNVSAIAGYSMGDNKLANPGFAYGGEYRSSQWSVQGAVNGSYQVGPVRLSPTVSLLYVPMNNHSFVDSTGATVPGNTTALTRGAAGGAISLPMTGWEPYFRAAAEYDLSVPTGAGANGNVGGTIGAGTTVSITQTVWLAIDGGYNSLGRTGLSLWSGSARINMQF